MPIRRVPPSRVEEGVVATSEATWRYWRIPTVAYDVLGPGQRTSLALGAAAALAGLRQASCHLIVASRPWPVATWRACLDVTAGEASHASDAWGAYSDVVATQLEAAACTQRQVFLGVRQSSAPEAVSLGRSLATSELRAVPASTGDLTWLLQRGWWRALGPPPTPAGVSVRNHPDHLVLDRGGERSFVAFLGAARFPSVLDYPGGEWLHRFESVAREGVEVEASVRFELVPPRRAAKDTARKLADATDQAAHIAGTRNAIPLALAESIDAAAELEHAVSSSQAPLVYSWPRLAVSTRSARELAEVVGDLFDSYRDLGVELVRPRGDQLSLFLEAMPGGRLRRRSYQQRQPVVTLAGSMFHATSELGDTIGPYIGMTSGVTCTPVHFDPLAAALANRPTTVAICGAPGEGKTTLAQLLTYQMALRGAAVVTADPKGDAQGLLQLPGMEHAHQVQLGPEHAGLLDPFRLVAEPAEARLLAVGIVQSLLPPNLASGLEHALLACAGEETSIEAPSLIGMVRRLARSPSSTVRAAGVALEALAELPLSRLCFADNPRRAPLRFSAGAVIALSFSGIDLPAPGIDPSQQTLAERLAVAVMGLVTALCNRLVSDSAANLPKAVMFDEAWAITQSRVGANLVRRLARTGRSRNTALLLVSQNAGDLVDETVTNNVGAAFCFCSTDEAEVADILRLVRAEPSPEHSSLVANLRNGQCLFRDLEARIGVLTVDLVTEEIRKAFNTTPDRPW
ncbi:MAG: ATP-binding protein [Acidimicrobiales bacterium]